MKYINSFIVTHVLGPIGGTADYDEGWQKFKDVKANDKAEVKAIIKKNIKPFFDTRSANYKDLLKHTLAYYLTTDSLDFESHYDTCLIAFPPPDNAKLFFIWLWEVLFSEESYQISNAGEYVERYNIDLD